MFFHTMLTFLSPRLLFAKSCKLNVVWLLKDLLSKSDICYFGTFKIKSTPTVQHLAATLLQQVRKGEYIVF